MQSSFMQTGKAVLFVILLIAIAACNSTSSTEEPPGQGGNNPPSQEEDNQELVYLFEEGMAGYDIFRIPAIVKTTEGTLLAFAEARKEQSNGDSGNIDLVVRRSEDGGETWGNIITIWDEGDNTAGNPVPVVDRQTGVVHLLMTWNHGDDDWGSINNGTGKDTRRIFYTSSDDDGLTWKEPVEITAKVKKPNWRWYGTGPVHGIQIKEGSYKGRLVIPSYFTVIEDGELKSYSHVIYSDNGGKTWEPGAPTPQSGVGECTVAELPDGRLMLNMRSSHSLMRMVSFSEDGGESWSQPKADYELTDPQSQASLLSYQGKEGHTLLFANAASGTRVNMTIKMSTDEGENWSKQYGVYNGPSAYSDLVMLSENEIGILFEGGIGRPYEGIAFEIISLDEFE